MAETRPCSPEQECFHIASCLVKAIGVVSLSPMSADAESEAGQEQQHADFYSVQKA
jgi:hypothetical protein